MVKTVRPAPALKSVRSVNQLVGQQPGMKALIEVTTPPDLQVFHPESFGVLGSPTGMDVVMFRNDPVISHQTVEVDGGDARSVAIHAVGYEIETKVRNLGHIRIAHGQALDLAGAILKTLLDGSVITPEDLIGQLTFRGLPVTLNQKS